MNDLLQNWIDKIKKKDATKIAELYHKDGILLGTFSNIERRGYSLILDYFQNLFLSQIDVKIITKHQYETKSMSTVSGLYNFLVDGKEIKARFSFVYIKTKEEWKILSHHSSTLPKKD